MWAESNSNNRGYPRQKQERKGKRCQETDPDLALLILGTGDPGTMQEVNKQDENHTHKSPDHSTKQGSTECKCFLKLSAGPEEMA